MVLELKRQFYELINSLGYHITDSGEYKELFPWLMLRTNGIQSQYSYDTLTETVGFTLDIFSTYPGEKEILEIVENINANLNEFIKNSPYIIYGSQKSANITDDKDTGPVRKHGIIKYNFLLTGARGGEPDDATISEPNI